MFTGTNLFRTTLLYTRNQYLFNSLNFFLLHNTCFFGLCRTSSFPFLAEWDTFSLRRHAHFFSSYLDAQRMFTLSVFRIERACTFNTWRCDCYSPKFRSPRLKVVKISPFPVAFLMLFQTSCRNSFIHLGWVGEALCCVLLSSSCCSIGEVESAQW